VQVDRDTRDHVQPTAGEFDARNRDSSFVEIPIALIRPPLATNTTRSVDPTHAHAQLEPTAGEFDVLNTRIDIDALAKMAALAQWMINTVDRQCELFIRRPPMRVMYKGSESDQADSNSSYSRDSSNQNSASVDNYYDSASTQFFDDTLSDVTSDEGGVPSWNPVVYHVVGHTNEDHDFFWQHNIPALQQTFQVGEDSTDEDMPALVCDSLVTYISRLIDVVLIQEGQALHYANWMFSRGRRILHGLWPNGGGLSTDAERFLRRLFIMTYSSLIGPFDFVALGDCKGASSEI
jgi:hypothetical protein